MSHDLRTVLLRQYDIAWAVTDYHLKDLSTEECLWRPAAAGLHVHLGADGTWSADWPDHEGYGLGPSSIGWLTWHLEFWWSMVLDHSFGSGTLAREQVRWPGTAERASRRIRKLALRWRGLLEEMSEEDLRSTQRTRWPLEARPFHDVVAWLTVELTKNAAEIGYARFLFATTR